MIANHYREVVLVDMEYFCPNGERPREICRVWHELISGQWGEAWTWNGTASVPSFPTGPDVLFISHSLPAEFSCLLANGETLPTHAVDTLVEFKVSTNGAETGSKPGLVSALTYYGLDPGDAVEKDAGRARAQLGGPFTAEDKQQLLMYCRHDVESLRRLVLRMWPGIDWPRAIYRGRYGAAVARMRHAGIPLDVGTLALLDANRPEVVEKLIRRVDTAYGVYEGSTFKETLFEQYLAEAGLASAWPRLPSGRLSLNREVFKEMATTFPRLEQLRQLRRTTAQLHGATLAVGRDGRNRFHVFPFAAVTGRDLPKGESILGHPKWERGLIKPAPGMAVGHLDIRNQEITIAAALSGDAALLGICQQSDPYIEMAKLAGAVPCDATKESHPAQRSLFKTTMLGLNYGMGARTLATRIQRSESEARQLINLHRRLFSRFWTWSDNVIDRAQFDGFAQTNCGWRMALSRKSKLHSLKNWPMQAHGAEQLRLACSKATEAGIKVIAPHHDALWIEAPAKEIDDAVATTSRLISESGAELFGVPFQTDATVVQWPGRYMHADGTEMWNRVVEILEELAGRSVEVAA
jgi:DNA polymerase-1